MGSNKYIYNYNYTICHAEMCRHCKYVQDIFAPCQPLLSLLGHFLHRDYAKCSQLIVKFQALIIPKCLTMFHSDLIYGLFCGLVCTVSQCCSSYLNLVFSLTRSRLIIETNLTSVPDQRGMGWTHNLEGDNPPTPTPSSPVFFQPPSKHQKQHTSLYVQLSRLQREIFEVISPPKPMLTMSFICNWCHLSEIIKCTCVCALMHK